MSQIRRGAKIGAVLDLLVLLLLINGVLAQTPLGQGVVWGMRVAMKYGGVDFLRIPAKIVEVHGQKKASRRRALGDFAWVEDLAEAHHVEAELLVAALQSFAVCPPDTVISTPDGCEVVIHDGLNNHRVVDLNTYAQALSAQAPTFAGDGLLAAQALILGAETLKSATERAEAAGEDAPWSWRDYQNYMPPLSRAARGEDIDLFLYHYTVERLTWPVAEKYPVTSNFGMRKHPVLGTSKLHNGIDLGTPTGTPAHASGSGRVKNVGKDSINGRYLTLELEGGVIVTYCHLDSVAVGSGDWVHRGDLVAKTGRSGRITGPHLHYTLRLAGEPVDPALYHHYPEP